MPEEVWTGRISPPGERAQQEVHCRSGQGAKLQAAVRDALEEPALRESFRKLGVQPAFVKGDDFARQIRKETLSFAALVNSVGFVPEA